MEELTIEERPGLLSKLFGKFSRREEEFEEEPMMADDRSATIGGIKMKPAYRTTVSVRRQITAFDDAMAAANGLKLGEMQILNLSATDPVTREKIKDFICGVNYAVEGTWEEVGEHIYMVVPAGIFVEAAPPTPRMHAGRN